jgi:hypothetical protein
MTYNHQGEFKTLLNRLSVHLIGKIGESDITRCVHSRKLEEIENINNLLKGDYIFYKIFPGYKFANNKIRIKTLKVSGLKIKFV